jgi:hypothetical protein
MFVEDDITFVEEGSGGAMVVEQEWDVALISSFELKIVCTIGSSNDDVGCVT